jgi:hypothetical protein
LTGITASHLSAMRKATAAFSKPFGPPAIFQPNSADGTHECT